MRTWLGVLLTALAVSGCSFALDMDRFNRGSGEPIADDKSIRSGKVAEMDGAAPDSGVDAGAEEAPAPPAADGGPGTPPFVCTVQEKEPNGSEPDAEPLKLGTTTCAVLAGDRDTDWFQYAAAGRTSVTIDAPPNVTVFFYRNHATAGTHEGGKKTHTFESGFIQLWVTGIGPGPMAYRMTLEVE